jgi:N6-L-threonylcarbamoyladenine synthase
MRQAGVGFHGLDAVAVTAGPGLIGGLIVGIATARTIALVHGLPLAAVNHLEGHALTVGLTEGLRPPYLLLLVSGGHTQLVLVEAVGRYQRLGSTIDDALGEAFDKTAKLLGLPMPGGPAIERTAANGDPTRIALPRPMAGRPEPNFSFAGLKTAVRLEAEARVPLGEQDVADIAAAFESAAVASVVDRTRRAMQLTEDRLPGANALSLVVAGGVAANRRLRSGLGDLVQGGAGRPSHAGGDGATLLPTWRLAVPPGNLCTDNAAMIAWAGAERLAAGLDLGTLVARARWPLDEAAAPLIGAGRHGMKA